MNAEPEVERIWDGLKSVLDPDVHVNIVDLGLIYDIYFDAKSNTIVVKMTLTSPTCPMGDTLFYEVETIVTSLYPERLVRVDIVWDPPWNPDMITELGKMELGLL